MCVTGRDERGDGSQALAHEEFWSTQKRIGWYDFMNAMKLGFVFFVFLFNLFSLLLFTSSPLPSRGRRLCVCVCVCVPSQV